MSTVVLRTLSGAGRSIASKRRRSFAEAAAGSGERGGRRACVDTQGGEAPEHCTGPRLQTMCRVEETVAGALEERDVVAEHRAPEGREVVEEAAPARGARVVVELHVLPQHGARELPAREVTGADVHHVAVVAAEIVGIRDEAFGDELIAHLRARVRRQALHDREIEAEAA